MSWEKVRQTGGGSVSVVATTPSLGDVLQVGGQTATWDQQLTALQQMAQGSVARYKNFIDKSISHLLGGDSAVREVLVDPRLSPASLSTLNNSVSYIIEDSLRLFREKGHDISPQSREELNQMKGGIGNELSTYTNTIGSLKGHNTWGDLERAMSYDTFVQKVQSPLIAMSREIDVMNTILNSVSQ